jgi:hypothetical protein
MIRRAIGIPSLILLLAALGCVERKMTVTSNPPGARFYLDDQEMGQTPVTFRFDFYGHRTFMLKKDGYRVTEEVRDVKAPVYEWLGFDVFADLGPIPFKDQHTFHFDLQPITEVKTDQLIERAKGMKSRLEGGAVPATAPASEKPQPSEGGKKSSETTPPSETKPEPVKTPPDESKPGAPAPAR